MGFNLQVYIIPYNDKMISCTKTQIVRKTELFFQSAIMNTLLVLSRNIPEDYTEQLPLYLWVLVHF